MAPAFVSFSRNDQIVRASGTQFYNPSPRKTHKRQAIIDQELRAFVGEIIGRLNDQNLEHHPRIEWPKPSSHAVRIGERRFQFRAEYLEIHNRPERLELVAKIAQPLQSIIDIKKSRLVSRPAVTMESEITQIGEVSRTAPRNCTLPDILYQTVARARDSWPWYRAA